MVRYCTGLGTMSVLVDSLVVVVRLRNSLGVLIGTWCNVADDYCLVICNIDWSWCNE